MSNDKGPEYLLGGWPRPPQDRTDSFCMEYCGGHCPVNIWGNPPFPVHEEIETGYVADAEIAKERLLSPHRID